MKKFLCRIGFHWWTIEWSFNTSGYRWNGQKMVNTNGKHGVKACDWCNLRAPL